MVKRNNRGGRRQILQLEDKKPAPGPSAKTQIRNLIHYSDSDEDSKKSFESDAPAAQNSQNSANSQSAPLDSQVADFLKEIDAMTVKEAPLDDSEAEPAQPVEVEIDKRPEGDKTSIMTDKEPQPGKSTDGVQSEGPYCLWQEICDDSTGYSYYWNVETNEVTWECPPEYFQYLKQLNLNSITTNNDRASPPGKQLKKKKESVKLPEGAIIPISYFGGSSSDESSDDSSAVCVNVRSKKVESKGQNNPTKKKTVTGGEVKGGMNKTETFDVIGPQLPPDFQFPESVAGPSSQNDTSVQSTKNEVEEFLEIGPQLPRKIEQLPFLENDVDSNVTDNDIDGVKSEMPGPAPSNMNSDLSVESSQVEDSWEESLMNIEKQFKSIDKEHEEIPDSTTRKDDVVEHSTPAPGPCQTSSGMNGLRLVVEYSFTDEEDESSSGDISSTKRNNDSNGVQTSSGCQVPEKTKVDSDYSNGPEPSKMEDPPEEAFPSRDKTVDPQTSSKNGILSEEPVNSLKEDKSRSSIDIDSMFAAHSTFGKYGFGFSRRKQLQLENDDFCSSSSQSYAPFKSKSDYRSINFIKSDHILDLRELNKNTPVEDNKEPVKVEDNPLGNSVPDEVKSEQPEVSHSESNSNAINVFKEPRAVTKVKESLPGSSTEEVKIKKDIPSRRKRKVLPVVESDDSLPSCSMEIGFDEIDKALSDALEEKRALANKLSQPSTSKAGLSEEQKTADPPSVPSNKKIKTERKEPSSGNSRMMREIIDLSSVLVDKLTFLLSNHSTLASLNALLVQMQTRVVDWQAGALESKYLMARLQEVHQYLHHYEVGAVSGDWRCQWDRENKRYFYVNERTQHSQWTFPGEATSGEKLSWPSTSSEATASARPPSSYRIRSAQFPLVSSSMSERQLQKSGPFIVKSERLEQDTTVQYPSQSARWRQQSSPPPPPPGVDSPPPPPPQTPPPESPPPPPPDSTEVEELPQDMELENSSDSDSVPFILKAEPIEKPPVQFKQQFLPECSSTRSPEHRTLGAVSSTSVTCSERPTVIARSPQPVSTSLASSEAIVVQQSSSVTNAQIVPQNSCVIADDGNGAIVPDVSSLTPTRSVHSTDRAVPSTSGVSFHRKSSPSGTTKKEKKKSKLLAGLALKKKNIPSLVQKWQKIKEEQDKEDKNSDEAKISTSM